MRHYTTITWERSNEKPLPVGMVVQMSDGGYWRVVRVLNSTTMLLTKVVWFKQLWWRLLEWRGDD